jgi:hypothetical protein
MSHRWDGQPLCQGMRQQGKKREKCTNLARYVILAPPLVYTLTPTPVYLEDENPTRPSVQRRAYPTHCRECAYLFCGLEVRGGGPTPPATLEATGVSH